jgi:CubicO group peptidase (beta-lactamase class C family)
MTLKTWTGLVSITLLGWASTVGTTRATAQTAQVDSIDAAVIELMALSDVPGLSLTMVEDGKVAWERGYGVRQAAQTDPVDGQTVFEAASLSKPVFAYVILQLIDQGILELDRPLIEYFTYDDLSSDERNDLITTRMILTHTSGLPNWRRGEPLTFLAEPGERFSYSGEGFMYLQVVVEHLTGESLEELAARLVFRPLGMTRSSFVWVAEEYANFASPHNRFGPMDKGEASEPAAAYSLHTTSGDYAVFLAAVMRGDGLSDSLHAALMDPHVEVDVGVSWGLGWGLQWTGQSHLGMWHWGHNTGYRAYVLGFPERGRGLVIFTNSDNGMLLLADLVGLFFEGDQPAIAWLDYETHDAPARLVRMELEEVIRLEGIEAGVERIRVLRATAPPEAFEESTLNALGYDLLRGQRVDEAIVIFQLNTAMYPNASNTYDSLGEAYLEKGDYNRALANYRTSVRLNPDNTNGHVMIERIKKTMLAEGA